MSAKSYEQLKAEMEAIQQQMVEAKKNERADALKTVKRICKEFGFTAGMSKGALASKRKSFCAQVNYFTMSALKGGISSNWP